MPHLKPGHKIGEVCLLLTQVNKTKIVTVTEDVVGNNKVDGYIYFTLFFRGISFLIEHAN